MHTQFYCKTGTAIIILFELVFFPLMVYCLLTIYPVYRVLLPLKKKKSRCTEYTINYLTAIYSHLVGWGFLLLVNCLLFSTSVYLYCTITNTANAHPKI